MQYWARDAWARKWRAAAISPSLCPTTGAKSSARRDTGTWIGAASCEMTPSLLSTLRFVYPSTTPSNASTYLRAPIVRCQPCQGLAKAGACTVVASDSAARARPPARCPGAPGSDAAAVASRRGPRSPTSWRDVDGSPCGVATWHPHNSSAIFWREPARPRAAGRSARARPQAPPPSAIRRHRTNGEVDHHRAPRLRVRGAHGPLHREAPHGRAREDPRGDGLVRVEAPRDQRQVGPRRSARPLHRPIAVRALRRVAPPHR